jgi:hypothetical protein
VGIAYEGDMKSGIWREDEGFQVMVDGVDRVLSDDYDGALDLARNLKRTNRQNKIEIRTRLDGSKREMLEDGRIR